MNETRIDPLFVALLVLAAFALGAYPLTTIHLSSMGSGQFFFETVTPFPYWIGLLTILAVLFLFIPHLSDSRSIGVFLFSSILLMILMRLVFPVIFTNIVIYEPDSTSYLGIVSSWLRTSLDFGHSGNYQHDYPLSFFIAFLFGKLGVSVEPFYRFAPFFLYAFDLILVYLILTKLTNNPKLGAVSAFLLAISPLNYWLSVHYCPDLVGSVFFLLSLYLLVRLIKSEFQISTVLPLLISIILLILSHHLGTLYFIVATVGLAFSAWYFKLSYLKDKALIFFIVAVFTYTFWFVYGTFMYPDFFNVYTYFSQAGSAITLSMQANLFENFTFALYPATILLFCILYLKETIGLRNVLAFVRSPIRWIRPSSIHIALPIELQYSAGYFLVLGLFFVGIAIPNIFAPRVLEVLLIGLYPIAALGFLSLITTKPSKKRTIILLILLIILVILSAHRYYSQIQGRIGTR